MLKMRLARFFISGSLELLKEQILAIMICMFFSSHKLYYF
ncbi:hypothetical protein C1336_000070073 [Campylobacter jejuni subsp. jejuni 1336]|nr:hypothetical protein C1336_000070073 [Campylobacter jejuni subsp. jejuni 1336]